MHEGALKFRTLKSNCLTHLGSKFFDFFSLFMTSSFAFILTWVCLILYKNLPQHSMSVHAISIFEPTKFSKHPSRHLNTMIGGATRNFVSSAM